MMKSKLTNMGLSSLQVKLTIDCLEKLPVDEMSKEIAIERLAVISLESIVSLADFLKAAEASNELSKTCFKNIRK